MTDRYHRDFQRWPKLNRVFCTYRVLLGEKGISQDLQAALVVPAPIMALNI